MTGEHENRLFIVLKSYSLHLASSTIFWDSGFSLISDYTSKGRSCKQPKIICEKIKLFIDAVFKA